MRTLYILMELKNGRDVGLQPGQLEAAIPQIIEAFFPQQGFTLGQGCPLPLCPARPRDSGQQLGL